MRTNIDVTVYNCVKVSSERTHERTIAVDLDGVRVFLADSLGLDLAQAIVTALATEMPGKPKPSSAKLSEYRRKLGLHEQEEISTGAGASQRPAR